MAEDPLFPFGGAAASEGNALGVEDAVAIVSVIDFAVDVTDVLVVDGFSTPLPLA